MSANEGAAIEATRGAQTPREFKMTPASVRAEISAQWKALDLALRSKSGLRRVICGWWTAIVVSYLAAFLLALPVVSYLPSLLLIASRLRIRFISWKIAIFAWALFFLSIAPSYWMTSLFVEDGEVPANVGSVLAALSAGFGLMFLATLVISDVISFREDPKIP